MRLPRTIQLDSEIEQSVRKNLRLYKETIPLLFSDNSIIENQMLLYREVDYDGGLFQLSESKFKKTQNRRENLFLDIYKAIKEDLNLGDWNAKGYGELKQSEVSLLASLLNIQANALDGITPGVMSADQCEYITKHVTENTENSIKDCMAKLNKLVSDDNQVSEYEKYFAEDEEDPPSDGFFTRIPFSTDWNVFSLPLPEINENSPAFGIEVKMVLLKADLMDELSDQPHLRDFSIKGERAEPLSFKVYVGAAENCREATKIEFLTDFDYSDNNYFRQDYNHHVVLPAAYDLTQCEGQKRHNLCLYTKSNSTVETKMDLLLRTAQWPPEEDYFGELGLKSLRSDKKEDQCMNNYESWLPDLTQANVTMNTFNGSTISLRHSYEKDSVRNASIIETDLQELQAYLHKSAKISIVTSKFFIPTVVGFSIFLLIVIVIFVINHILKQKAIKMNQEPETIYTVVRAAPKSMRRKFSKMRETYKAGKKRAPKPSNNGLPPGVRPEDASRWS